MWAHQAIYFFLTLTVAHGAKILVISQILGKSHHMSFLPFVESLADRKHEITFITYFPYKYQNVQTMLMIPPDDAMGDPEVMKDFILNAQKHGPIRQFQTYVMFAESNCASMLKEDFVKKFVKAGKQFDVAIVDALFGECPMSIASLMAKNVIYYYSSNWLMPWMNEAVPTPYSYVPNSIQTLPTKMTFWQRLQNMFTMISLAYVHKYCVKAAQEKVLSNHLPQAPSVFDIDKLVDFTLINGDPVTVSPRPSMPNMLDAGGMHCREAKPLPEELKRFVDESGDDGFILFALGSNMKSEYMSPQLLKTIHSAFSRLKQRIVWKFEGKLESVPKNVKIIQWMPQQDLLGHPKARLFITHSGLLSLQEAIYHGVPMLGMPFFADQPGNIARIKDLGIGEILDFANITDESFYPMIQQILNDKRYSYNMKKYSAIFKDRPVNPVDSAVFWIEYVIRHNGAKHLRSAGEDLKFFQYFLLDVIAFSLLVVVVTLSISLYLLKFFVRRFFNRTQSVQLLLKKSK